MPYKVQCNDGRYVEFYGDNSGRLHADPRLGTEFERPDDASQAIVEVVRTCRNERWRSEFRFTVVPSAKVTFIDSVEF